MMRRFGESVPFVPLTHQQQRDIVAAEQALLTSDSQGDVLRARVRMLRCVPTGSVRLRFAPMRCVHGAFLPCHHIVAHETRAVRCVNAWPAGCVCACACAPGGTDRVIETYNASLPQPVPPVQPRGLVPTHPVLPLGRPSGRTFLEFSLKSLRYADVQLVWLRAMVMALEPGLSVGF
jgi:hypothetical protein